jgi:hypothetical protein
MLYLKYNKYGGHMSNIVINKVYNFQVENFEFGGLSRDACIEIFKDGRVASHFLERQLTIWFPTLTHIKGCKDHDHIDADGVKYDAKNFTKRGLIFMPSNQMGAGRKFNESVAHEKAKKLIFICCDIVDFPIVRVKFADGAELAKQYPTCKIKKGDREEFFNDESC